MRTKQCFHFIMLIGLLIGCLFPAKVSASPSVLATGPWGDNVTYTIYSDMSMVISGKGSMWDENSIPSNYMSSIESVTIEEGVTTIGKRAFRSYSNLTSVTIPSSITDIGKYAFENCTSLNSVTIPYGVATIDAWAFNNCYSLASVTIPNSVTTIAVEVFGNCTSLTSVTIPSSVTIVAGSVFSGCTALSSIIVDADNAIFDSRNNCNAIIETSTNKLIVGCKNTVIPNSVTSIGEDAFENCTGLTSMTIPNSVTEIGWNAFMRCSGLTSVTIPSSVTDISGTAFKNCTGLTSITCESETPVGLYEDVFDGVNKSSCTLYVPAGSKSAYENAEYWNLFTHIVEQDASVLATGPCGDNVSWSFDTNTGVLTISGTGPMWDYEWTHPLMDDEYNGSITSVTVEEGVTSIGDYAFYENPNLTSITISNSVTRIGSGAFCECTGLTSFTIPNSVTNIDNDAFLGTTWYNNQPDGLVYINNVAYKYKGTMPEGTSIAVRNGTISISECAFSSCTGLTSVTIPNSVTIISRYAFDDCTNLTSITCESLTPVNITNSVFSGVNKSTCTLNVPAGSKTAYQSAAVWSEFTNIVEQDASVLATGQCGDNLTYTIYDDMSMVISGTGPMWDYSEEAMMNSDYMGSIKSVTIEEGCTAIGAYAFNCCYEVTSVTFPNSLTAISEFAFKYCVKLTSLNIPNGVIAIGDYAFDNCCNLSSITVDDGNTAYDSRDNCNAIINTELDKLILGCKNTVIPVGVTSIGERAFIGCQGLTSIDIPDGVTEIGWWAFMSCHDLTAVSIPHGVTQIGAFAFLDCNSLTSVAIPNSVTYLGGNAFTSCTGLTTVTVEWNTPLEIESNAFENVDKSACILYVPTGTKSVYQEAEVWGEFENIVEIGEIPDTDISALDNAIYIEQTEGLIGSTMDISVKMKNNYDVRAFQFKIELPEGTSINNWTLNQNRMPEGTTINDAITTDYIEGSGTVYACIIRPYMTFTGNDGEVVTINVTFANDMTPGIYPIFITNPALSDVEGSEMSLNEVKSTLVLTRMGDTNGDGQVLIGDVISILNFILGSPSDNFNAKAADLNDDGKILIGDVIAVLNIILNQ